MTTTTATLTAANRLVLMGMTPRQAEIYLYLVKHILDEGYQPSLRELCKRFKISTVNGVSCHMRALQAKGWVELEGMASRSIRLLRTPDGSPFNGLKFNED